MRVADYDTHPAADLFPLMEGKELADLAADIKAHGLLDPVVLLLETGKRLVLDGRNRLRACEMVGVAPKFEFWEGEGSPTEWVISRNVHRRHLTPSQRAMIAADLVPMLKAEAKARMVAAHAGSANLREQDCGKATEKAAAALNVSPRSVETALRVVETAPIETVAAVRRGEVAVSAAAKALCPPKLPATKKSKGPKASPTYSLLLVMPTEQAAEISKALRALGFEPVRHHEGHCDAEMKLDTHSHARIA